MSRAYKCDRCGAFYSSNAMREFDDLCEECTRQLKEWFEAGKKEVSEDGND